MWDRLLLSGFLIACGMGVFMALRGWHMRRASAADRATTVRGQPALLYFRSDNCAPCAAQWRYVQQIQAQFDGQVAVEKIDADADHERASRYGVFTLPTTLVIDHAGTVRHINYGLTDARKLAQQLETLVA
jgi:thioredoxin-like negative regulator of GroEL